MAVSNVQFNEFGAGSAYTRRKDVFDVTCDFATNKTANFLKTFYAIPGLFQNLGYLPADHAGLNGFCSAAKMGKLATKPFSLLDKIQTTQTSIATWLRGGTKKFKEKYENSTTRQITTLDVIRDANGCIGDAWETTEFFTKTLVSIPKASLRVFEGINGAALVFGMSCNLLLNTFTWINDSKFASLKGAEKDTKFMEMTGYLFKMAMEISYIALGIMIFLSAFFQVVFSPLAFAAVSAATVVFNILEYYHENLGEEKNLK